MLTVTEAARRLGIHPNTVRQWTRDYSDYFSPSGAPPKGQERRFAADDVVTLWTIHVLKQEGKLTDDILAELATGARIEPVEGQEPPGAPPGDKQATEAPAGEKRATEAATLALELVKGQVDALISERDWLRGQLEAEREARISAEREAGELRGRLARRPWWKFWEG